MEPIKYVPFSSPREFGWLMYQYYHLYKAYKPNLFSFDFLESSLDVKVICKETTAEEPDFPTPLALEKSIQDSGRINSPGCYREPSGFRRDPPADYDWPAWIGGAIHGVMAETGISREEQLDEPLFGLLEEGIIHNHHRCLLSYGVVRHHRNHWSLMLRDHLPLDPRVKDGKDYLLRGEIMGVTAILYRQMNEIHWDNGKNEYTKPKFIYTGGTLTATVVTFPVGKVRVVEAVCDPSDPNTSLTFTLRLFSDLRMSCYDKPTAQKVMKYILCPPGSARQIPRRGGRT